MSNRNALPASEIARSLYGFRKLQNARRRLGEHNTSKVNPFLLVLGHAVVDETNSRRVLFAYDVNLPGLDDDMKQDRRVEVSTEKFAALLRAGVGILGDRDNAAAMMLAFKSRRFARRLPAPSWSLTLHYLCVRQLFVERADFDKQRLIKLLIDWLNGRLLISHGDDETVLPPAELEFESIGRAILSVTEERAVEQSVDEQYMAIGWTPPSEMYIVKKMRTKNNARNKSDK
jgi:hypothetical protein